MKWLKYANIALIIAWLIVGIYNLGFAPILSKFSYGCIWVTLIVDLVCHTIERFIEEN